MRRHALASLDSRHSIPSDMSARRPAAFNRGATAKARSVALRRCRSRPAMSINAATPRLRASSPDPREPLCNEAPVVVVERDDVGNRTQRNEVE